MYSIKPLSDLLTTPLRFDWLIEDMLEIGTLALLVGEEGSFKSFIAIDMALCVATGRPWHEHKVKQGAVLYVPGEGRQGVIRRMWAWCDQYGCSPENLYVADRPMNLLNQEDVKSVQLALSERDDWALIVLDTLNRNLSGGDENSSQVMGAAVGSADLLRECTRATILLIHHTPLEGRSKGNIRPRGHSLLAAAADTIFTTRVREKTATLSTSKQKDADPAPDVFLAGLVVEFPEQDNMGNHQSTLVLKRVDALPAQSEGVRVRGKNQRALRKVLHDQAKAKGVDGVLSISEDELREIIRQTIKDRQRIRDLIIWVASWAEKSGGGYKFYLSDFE